MPRELKPKTQQGKRYTKKQKNEIIQSIKPYLQLEYDLKKACMLAGVPYTTVHTWVRKDNSLRIKIESWRNAIKARARRNIARSIDDGAIGDSKWWLERREAEEFKEQKNIEHKGTVSYEQFLKGEEPAIES